MSCLRPDRMDLYLEGELEVSERREFEAHLDRCPACREALEDRRAFERALSSLPPIEVPPGFAAAVMARVPAGRRRAFARLVAALSVTAALFTALLGYHLVTGETLAGILLAVGRSIAGLAGGVVTWAAKAFGLLGVLLDVAADFTGVLWRGLSALGSVYRPEVIGVILALAFGLSVLVALGVKKIVSLGERT
jgi:hypothetical protein